MASDQKRLFLHASNSALRAVLNLPTLEPGDGGNMTDNLIFSKDHHLSG